MLVYFQFFQTAIICKLLYCYWAIGIMVRVFANGSGDRGSIPGRVILKTQKMVFDAALLNTHATLRLTNTNARNFSFTFNICLSISNQNTIDFWSRKWKEERGWQIFLMAHFWYQLDLSIWLSGLMDRYTLFYSNTLYWSPTLAVEYSLAYHPL